MRMIIKEVISKNLKFTFLDDDKIWVDNKPIPKSQIDIIAKKILNNCNYYHEKKDKKDILKKKSGKMMITSGMTVEEFCKKFKVPI